MRGVRGKKKKRGEFVTAARGLGPKPVRTTIRPDLSDHPQGRFSEAGNSYRAVVSCSLYPSGRLENPIRPSEPAGTANPSEGGL